MMSIAIVVFRLLGLRRFATTIDTTASNPNEELHELVGEDENGVEDVVFLCAACLAE